jgi:hypothetical protein
MVAQRSEFCDTARDTGAIARWGDFVPRHNAESGDIARQRFRRCQPPHMRDDRRITIQHRSFFRLAKIGQTWVRHRRQYERTVNSTIIFGQARTARWAGVKDVVNSGEKIRVGRRNELPRLLEGRR